MDLAQLLIQTGALGLCGLLVLELRDVRKAIDRTGEKMAHLAAIIYDHKARAGDTPPERAAVRR